MNLRFLLPVVLLACVACKSGERTPPQPPGSGGARASTLEPAPVDPKAPDVTPDAGTPTPSAWTEGTSREGRFKLRWRSLSGQVPNNDHFKLELELSDTSQDDAPLEHAQVFVSAWMPDHSHGMVVQPRTVEQGGGKYLVEGMLFHMSGHWQLFFDVIDEDGLSERAEFDLDLKP